VVVPREHHLHCRRTTVEEEEERRKRAWMNRPYQHNKKSLTENG
jgi:hypothetical protein